VPGIKLRYILSKPEKSLLVYLNLRQKPQSAIVTLPRGRQQRIGTIREELTPLPIPGPPEMFPPQLRVFSSQDRGL
jgi:hypothetical protein